MPDIHKAKKITIFGYPATGKSTLAYTIGEKLNIPVFSIDKIRWQTPNKKRPETQFLRDFDDFFKHKSWVIEGNGLRYDKYIKKRFAEADIIFVFDTNKFSSVAKVFRRYAKIHIIKSETRLGAGDGAPFHLSKFILTKFPHQFANAKAELSNYSEKVIIIKNYRELRGIINTI